MTRYEIREICGDWAIYEVWETETEGGEECLHILNSRSNAEYVKAILEHEAKYPNAAVRYFPRAELMSDAEVLAVFRMCAADEVGACDKCPLKGRDVCREEINRRVLEMAEKYLEHRKNIELIRALIETAAECGAMMKGGRLEGWISVDERLPDDYDDYLVVVKHKYEYEDEWEYDVDVGGPALDAGYIDHFWKTYHDWEVGEECHITHWMPLPEPPMMKGGTE